VSFGQLITSEKANDLQNQHQELAEYLISQKSNGTELEPKNYAGRRNIVMMSSLWISWN